MKGLVPERAVAHQQTERVHAGCETPYKRRWHIQVAHNAHKLRLDEVLAAFQRAQHSALRVPEPRGVIRLKRKGGPAGLSLKNLEKGTVLMRWRRSKVQVIFHGRKGAEWDAAGCMLLTLACELHDGFASDGNQ